MKGTEHTTKEKHQHKRQETKRRNEQRTAKTP